MAFKQYAYPKFNREVKKLPQPLQEKVYSIQDQIAEDPYQGKSLKGALKGWRSYGFSFAGQSYRIAYKVNEEKSEVIFASIGTREGFYSLLNKFL